MASGLRLKIHSNSVECVCLLCFFNISLLFLGTSILKCCIGRVYVMRVHGMYAYVLIITTIAYTTIAQPCPPSWDDEKDPACECDLSCTLGREVGPDRLCPYGHHVEWVDSTCAPCANASEVERCMACPPGVYESTTACGCDASCVSGYHPGPDRLCPYNHHIEWVDSTCAPCTNAVEIERCVPCPPGKWCPTGDTMYDCAVIGGSVDIVCDEDTFPQCGGCHQCSHSKPLLCGQGSPPTDSCGETVNCSSGCGPGQYTLDMQTCLECPPGHYCPDGLRRAKCTPGYYCPAAGAPEPLPCPEGHWCTGLTQNQCAQNSWSDALSGIQRDCKCLPGYSGSTGGLCTECPVDHWCPGEGGAVVCPTDSVAVQLSSSPSDCHCRPGFHNANNSTDEGCEYGGGGLDTHECEVGIGVQSDCSCRPGFYKETAQECALCPEGHYCLGGEHIATEETHRRTGHTIEACPQHSVSVNGSNHSTACICDRGYYGPQGGPCELCPANSWCWGGVENLCSPDSPISAPGVSWPQNCTCVQDGYCEVPAALPYRRVQPTMANREDCYIDAADGKVYCWGQIDANSVLHPITEIEMPALHEAIDVKTGGDPAVMCVHFSDLTVKCMGSNTRNQLGVDGGGLGRAQFATDPARVRGGLQLAPNSLVLGQYHLCGIHDADRTMVTCWGFSTWGYNQVKTFPVPVRALFAYKEGTFALLEDNVVYQWGYYRGDSRWNAWKAHGWGLKDQELMRWYPEKEVYAIYMIDKWDVCFGFVDGTFSCTGRYAQNIDFSANGATSSVARYNYWPYITFGQGHGGQVIRNLVAQTESNALVYILYESGDVGRLSFGSKGNDVQLLQTNPGSSAVILSIYVSELTALVFAHADGMWGTWDAESDPTRVGYGRLAPIQAIANETGRVPLLEYTLGAVGGPCVCTRCPNKHWCDFGAKTQCTTCDSPFGINQTCSATVDSTCECGAAFFDADTSPGAFDCQACPAGYICEGTRQLMCPANSWCSGGMETLCTAPFLSLPGSHLASNCTCPAGSVAWDVVCPDGFVHYPGSMHCYEVKGISPGSPSSSSSTWRQSSAFEYCSGRGGRLLSNVQSFAELEWVNQLGAQNYWIDARWDVFDETYYWADGAVDYAGIWGEEPTPVTVALSSSIYIPSQLTGFRAIVNYANWLKTVCQTDKPDDICVDSCATDQFWCDSDGVPQACNVTCPFGSGIASTCSYASDGVCEVCASNLKYASAVMYQGTPTATYTAPSSTYPGCVPCPAGHYCVGGVDIPCPAGSLCTDGVKTDCPANSWCVDNIATPCDTNLVSIKGSFDKANCVSPCEAGTYVSGGGVCKPCEVAHYCPGGGDMFLCPQNSSAPILPGCVPG